LISKILGSSPGSGRPLLFVALFSACLASSTLLASREYSHPINLMKSQVRPLLDLIVN
jgi:hypothetical protein